MKGYLFHQWENEKKRVGDLENRLQTETRRADDARAQARADKAMKEYLAEQWQREEERVRKLVSQSSEYYGTLNRAEEIKGKDRTV